MTDVMTPQIRAAIAQQSNKVFADPNATTAEVLDAMVSYLTINSVQFHTASGEISTHLQAAAKSCRELELARQTTGRRFLGMPREEIHGGGTPTVESPERD